MLSPALPNGAYYYKNKNGKHIYKNSYTDEFYIVYQTGGNWIVETYKGECNC